MCISFIPQRIDFIGVCLSLRISIVIILVPAYFFYSSMHWFNWYLSESEIFLLMQHSMTFIHLSFALYQYCWNTGNCIFLSFLSALILLVPIFLLVSVFLWYWYLYISFISQYFDIFTGTYLSLCISIVIILISTYTFFFPQCIGFTSTYLSFCISIVIILVPVHFFYDFTGTYLSLCISIAIILVPVHFFYDFTGTYLSPCISIVIILVPVHFFYDFTGTYFSPCISIVIKLVPVHFFYIT